MTIQTHFDLYIAVVEMPHHLAFPDDDHLGEPSTSEDYGFDAMDELCCDGSYDSNFDDSSFAFESDEDDEGSISRILESYRQLAFGTYEIEANPTLAARRHFFELGDDDSLDMANRRGLRRTEADPLSIERSTSIGDDDSLGLSRTRRLRGMNGVRTRHFTGADDDDDSSSSEESISSNASLFSDFDYDDETYELPINDQYEFVHYQQGLVQEVPSKASEFEYEETTQALSGLSLDSSESVSSLPPLISAAEAASSDDEDDDSDSSYFEDFVFEELVVPLKGGDDVENKDDSCYAAVQRKSISEQSQSSRRRAFRNRRALAE